MPNRGMYMDRGDRCMSMDQGMDRGIGVGIYAIEFIKHIKGLNTGLNRGHSQGVKQGS
jgi:hypothetical protein